MHIDLKRVTRTMWQRWKGWTRSALGLQAYLKRGSTTRHPIVTLAILVALVALFTSWSIKRYWTDSCRFSNFVTTACLSTKFILPRKVLCLERLVNLLFYSKTCFPDIESAKFLQQRFGALFDLFNANLQSWIFVLLLLFFILRIQSSILFQSPLFFKWKTEPFLHLVFFKTTRFKPAFK